MTTLEAQVEVFYQAFKGLKRSQKDALIKRLLTDKSFKEDLIDLAIIESRRKEPKRRFRDYLAESKGKYKIKK